MKLENANKTKKNRNYGGNNLPEEHEKILKKYAEQIKTHIFIDILAMEIELNKIESPLKHAMKFDSESNQKYTLNEYALIHEASYFVHNLFSFYEVDLTRKIKYPNQHLFSEKSYNILEAYILYSNFDTPIKSICEQILKYRNYDLLFEYRENVEIPTILKCANESRLFDNANRDIFRIIMDLYENPIIFQILTYNYDTIRLLNLIVYGIQSNNIELTTCLMKKVIDPNLLLEYIFSEQVINVILIHNNEEFYKLIIKYLNYYPDNIIEYVVCLLIQPKRKCTAKSIEKFMGLYKNKQYHNFFEYLGKYAIKNLLVPRVYNTPKIIIIAHGFSLGDEEYEYEFPFLSCCFFTEKGKILKDAGIMNKHIEELICAGNYDLNLKCTESKNGKIIMEDIRFSFIPTTTMHGKNNTLGFYLCNNRIIQKIPVMGIQNKSYYFQEMIDITSEIANLYQLNKNNIEFIVFSCRGYIGEMNVQEVIPTAILHDTSITPETI